MVVTTRRIFIVRAGLLSAGQAKFWYTFHEGVDSIEVKETSFANTNTKQFSVTVNATVAGTKHTNNILVIEASPFPTIEEFLDVTTSEFGSKVKETQAAHDPSKEKTIPKDLEVAFEAALQAGEKIVGKLVSHQTLAEALIVTDRRVIIGKLGFSANASGGGVKTISFPLSGISSVEVSHAGRSGRLQISVPGMQDAPQGRALFNGRTARLENVITIKPSQVDAAREVARQIDELCWNIRQPGSSATPVPSADASRSNVADELSSLARLRDQGILTDAEFATAKGKLLAKL